MNNEISSEKVELPFSSGSFKDFSQETAHFVTGVRFWANLLQKTLDSLTDAIFILDAEVPPKIISCNRAASTVFGYAKEEMIGKTTTFLHMNEESLKEFQSLLYPAMEKGNIHFQLPEYAMKRKDGSVFPSEHSITQLLSDEGQCVGWISRVRDITERKKTERMVRESQQKFERLFMHNPEAAVYWDKDFRVLDVNPRSTELFGYSLDEIRGKSTTGLIVPEDKVEESDLLGRKAREGYVDHDTVRKRKDGSLVPVSMSVAPMIVAGQLVGYVGLYKDITERKKAEETLRKSEEKYRNLFENAQDTIVTIDLEGKIISVNRAVQKHGYDTNEIIDKSVFDLIPKEEWQGRQRNLRELAQGRSTESEFKIKRKDKPSYAVVEARSNPIYQGNDVIGIQTIMRDVTERREMEEKLRDNEEKLRAITVSANDAILLIDDKGEFSYWNPAAEKMFGYTKEEVENKVMYELIASERFRGDHMKAFEKFKKTGEGHIIGKTVEMAAIRRDGTEFPVEFSLSALQVKGKQYALGIVRDITERKKMEEGLKQYSEHLEELIEKKNKELLESEKRYSVLVDEASDGVAIIQDEKIVFVNKKTPDIIGHTREEVIGLPFETFLDENYRQRAKELYQRKLRGEATPSTLEIEWIAKTSEHVPVELSATLINYQGCPAILAIIRDISERKRIEEQHAKLEKLATIGELATMVAHDLRNPLTSIRNASFYIKGGCRCREDPERKNVLEMLDIIEQETIFANNIINDLLDFAAKRPLQKKRRSINKIIEGLLTESNVPENIEVERRFAKKAAANADEKQLERVFLNLVKNAVQAMPNSGKLTVTTTETKYHIEITFTDTGTGIAEENTSKIFTPLFTTKAKGIGMGLAICKRIVEEHGGTIDFKSKVGQGTTFAIKLPKNKEASDQ
jgi:two-component system sporulation sensor kinase A